jgi:hypothetical protein
MGRKGIFDSIGAFERQFIPIEGGYLYYPSSKSGGKLVTAEEFESLRSDWVRIAGRGGRWKNIAVVVAGLVVWEIVSVGLEFPRWTTWLAATSAVIFISARIMRVSLAPRRLVKDRPAITPPRPATERGRQARAMINWPFVIFVLVVSGLIFWASLASQKYTFSWWAWTVGSGAMFVAYIWVAFRKLQDRLIEPKP